MPQNRDSPSRFKHLAPLDRRHDHLGTFAAFCRYVACRSDRKTHAKSLPAAFVQAALRRRQDETAGLDGTSAQEHMPMRLTRHLGESRGYRQHLPAALSQLPDKDEEI